MTGVGQEGKRFDAHKQEAFSHQGEFPPTMEVIIKEHCKKHQHKYKVSTFQDQLKGSVLSFSRTDTEFKTDLTPGSVSCECGKLSVYGLPCVHLFAHSISVGIKPSSLFDHRLKTAGWQQQYEGELKVSLCLNQEHSCLLATSFLIEDFLLSNHCWDCNVFLLHRFLPRHSSRRFAKFIKTRIYWWASTPSENLGGLRQTDSRAGMSNHLGIKLSPRPRFAANSYFPNPFTCAPDIY